MTSQVLEFHRTGKLRLLAITNPTIAFRSRPDIPTAAEAGVPGLVTTQVIGIFAPAGTAGPVLAKIAEANHVAMADKTYQQSLVESAVIPVTDWTPRKIQSVHGRRSRALDAAGQGDRGAAGIGLDFARRIRRGQARS